MARAPSKGSLPGQSPLPGQSRPAPFRREMRGRDKCESLLAVHHLTSGRDPCLLATWRTRSPLRGNQSNRQQQRSRVPGVGTALLARGP